MMSSILALASLLLSGYIALAMKMPLAAEDSSSLGSLLKSAMNRRQAFAPGNAVAPRQRRSARQDDSPALDSKYGGPQGRKYDGTDNQFGPYYNRGALGPYRNGGSFDSPGGDEFPLISERSFDSLGGGEVPWVDRRSKAGVGDSRLQERNFDTLGGGEIQWIHDRSFGKRAHQRK